MKPCLEDSELLRLVAAAGDGAAPPDHFKDCSGCATRYDEVARDAGTIACALTHAADHLIGSRPVAETYTNSWFDDGFRLAAIFSGATALGGAVAFALLLTLGWRPVSASNQLARAAGHPSTSEIASNQRPAATSRTVASNDAASAGSRGALYNAEALTNDPWAGLAYGDSQSAPDASANEDMLFCVPGDDGTICTSAADQR